MQADPGVQLVAMADLFEDVLLAKRKTLTEIASLDSMPINS